LLLVAVMTWLKRSARRFSEYVARMFGRLAAVIIGLFMTVLGLAMTVTIVMLPVGVVIGLLGVALVISGIFAPIDPTLGSDQQ
jgi:hypothetical protein